MSEEELVKKLKLVAGVEGTVIVGKDGSVLAHELAGDEQAEGALASYVGNAASQIGEALNLGSFSNGVIETGDNTPVKTLVLEQPDYIVGLQLGETSSPTQIASEAMNILDADAGGQ